METITLKRTGDAPLKFEGELISERDCKWFNGSEQNRWFEILVYKTKGKKWVYAVNFHTSWQGEANDFKVEFFDDPQNLQAALLYYFSDHFVDLGVGFPSGRNYEDKQEQLMNKLEKIYNATVTEIYEDLPDDFCEEIE